MKTMTLDEFLAEYSSPDVIVARAARDHARRIFVAARIADEDATNRFHEEVLALANEVGVHVVHLGWHPTSESEE